MRFRVVNNLRAAQLARASVVKQRKGIFFDQAYLYWLPQDLSGMPLLR